MCIDVEEEEVKTQNLFTEECLEEKQTDPVDYKRVYEERVMRQCDAFLERHPFPEHSIRMIKYGMLYIGWDVTSDASSSQGCNVNHYQKFDSYDMKLYLL